MCALVNPQDYPWNAIGSIATAVGVLFALGAPIYRRWKEEKNLIYFQSKSLTRLLENVRYLQSVKKPEQMSDEELLKWAEKFRTLIIPNMDDDAKELAKYDTKLYEVLVQICNLYQYVKSNAQDFIESSDPDEIKQNRIWFEGSLANADCEVILNFVYLSKKKILKADWVPFF